MIKKCERLWSNMVSERQSFMPLWKELGEFILPRRPRDLVSDVNKGDRRSSKIIDSTATLAARTLRSGMMSLYTSPARPWFKLATSIGELAENQAVNGWLYEVNRRMNDLLGRTNIYNVLPILYGDMAVFATGAILVEEDEKDYLRFYSLPIASYCIGVDATGRVNMFAREFALSVRQTIEMFGEDAVSRNVADAMKRGDTETLVAIKHIIMPKEAAGDGPVSSKPFVSVYYESVGDSSRPPLKVGGHRYFPVLAGRWELTGGDAYGTSSPGIMSLGDIKQLQLGERRTMQAIDKMINPPLQAPGHLRTAAVSLMPGSVTYVDARDGRDGVRPIHDVTPRIQEMEVKQEQARSRIEDAFYVRMILMMSNSDRREITAREIEERSEEKLLMIGPVLGQINQDILDPLIDIVFNVMQRRGLIPEPPQELAGSELKVEYTSVLAQAQRMVGIGGVERFAQFASGLATVNPAVLDKLNLDQMLDVYGDMASVPPGLLVDDEQVAAIRQQRAQMQQTMQQAEAAKTGSAAVANMSKAIQ